ncbi:DUF305 domain-containing protein [Gordonia sp. NB41Y]|uniref:DUF305 domain-containing protein n=1 Tax=Gordonia sp. NB41Y TaxID=875808 RepID=UPI0002BF2644|nr:DUF305 domain-containing protein [Gordonia sp. NB41Y]WLP88954.1 DUF305 domain-containing protein [Gordonia sp. NB41Y]
MNHLSTRALVAAAGAVTAVALVTGCSSDDNTSGDGHGDHAHMTMMSATPSGTVASTAGQSAHNQADVMFNQMMIPHHEQAVAMADLVPTRTDNAELRTLATQIRSAQQPEIDQMNARLASWGVGSGMGSGSGGSGTGDMGHENMGHGTMNGMMTPAQMTALEQASGAEFDKLWLTGMIAHHEGAVSMAETELADGVNPESRAMATQIKTSQQAEIDQMKTMLGQ